MSSCTRPLSYVLLCGASAFVAFSCTPPLPQESHSETVSSERKRSETPDSQRRDAGTQEKAPDVSVFQDVRNSREPIDDTSDVLDDSDSGAKEEVPENAVTDTAPSPVPYSIKIDKRGRAASILLPQKEFDAWLAGQRFQRLPERQKFAKRIYAHFKDSFDFIFLVLNVEKSPKTVPAGRISSVSNAVRGIGLPIYNTASQFGSAGKLKALMLLSQRNYLLAGPSLHELMHHWGNYVLDTRMPNRAGQEVPTYGHWGISDIGGQLGGFDALTFKKNVDGHPHKYCGHMPGQAAFGFYANGGNSVPYSNFELYLMGLIPKSQVKPVRVFHGISIDEREFFAKGTFHAKTVLQYTIDQIVGAPLNKGDRLPNAATSQKSFRALAIMLTSKPLTKKEWDDFDDQVAKFSLKGNDNDYRYNFWEATGGRASMEMGDLQKEKKTP